jgi:hypothetical protein
MNLFLQVSLYWASTTFNILMIDLLYGGSIFLASLFIVPSVTIFHVLFAILDMCWVGPSYISFLIYLINAGGTVTFLVFLLFFQDYLSIDQTWWEEASKKYKVYGILLVTYTSVFTIILVIYYTRALFKKSFRNSDGLLDGEEVEMGTDEFGLVESNYKLSTSSGYNQECKLCDQIFRPMQRIVEH